MKGLIRNNIYNIDQILKLLIGMMVFSLLFVASSHIFVEQMPNAIQYSDLALLSTIGAFSSVSIEMLKNEAMSKWSRFELTTPITKGDVIKARYITYTIFAFIAIIFLLVGFLIPVFFGETFDTYWFTYYLTLLLCFCFLSPAISHPLVVKFGIDKGMLFFMLSTFFSLAFFIAPTFIFADFLVSIPNSDAIYRLTISSISLIAFALSYIISKKMYIQKDL